MQKQKLDSIIYEMEDIPPLQRGHIYYLDRCRVEREGNRVVFKRAQGGFVAAYNIPYANTAFILLGSGVVHIQWEYLLHIPCFMEKQEGER